MHPWKVTLQMLLFASLLITPFGRVSVPEARASAMEGLLGQEVDRKPITLPATQPVALGAWVPGAPQDINRLDDYAALVGRMPAIVLSYQDWVHDATFQTAFMSAVRARGAMPLVTWEPWDYTQGADQPAFALRTIASGGHDAYIRQYARAAAAWGQPFYLRFAHEMNTTAYSWSASA
ncbi:MAG: hypothetical protein ACTHMR_18120, partial [Thermomicrobiales bacterium]